MKAFIFNFKTSTTIFLDSAIKYFKTKKKMANAALLFPTLVICVLIIIPFRNFKDRMEG